MGKKYTISNRFVMNLMILHKQAQLVGNIERSNLPNASSFIRDKTTSILFLKPTDQDCVKIFGLRKFINASNNVKNTRKNIFEEVIKFNQ